MSNDRQRRRHNYGHRQSPKGARNGFRPAHIEVSPVHEVNPLRLAGA